MRKRHLLGIVRVAVLFAAAAGVWLPSSATANTILRVHESTLNEFLAAVEPLTYTGWHEEFFCESDWEANVTHLSVDITLAEITLEADVDATWCDISFLGKLRGKGDVVRRLGVQAVEFIVESAEVTLSKRIDLWLTSVTVTLATVDITPQLTLPPFPIRPWPLTFESGFVGDRLIATPANVFVEKRNGQILLTADVSVR